MKSVVALIFFSALNLVLCEKGLSEYTDVTTKNTELDGFTAVKRYRIEKTTGVCTQFSYRGKGMDFNNFETLEECENHKKKTPEELLSEIKTIKASATVTPANPPTSLCEGDAVKKYYFKKTVVASGATPVSFSCLEFDYKGCSADNNIFEDRRQCEDAALINGKTNPNPFDCGVKPTIKLDHNNEIRVIANKNKGECIRALIASDQERGVFPTVEACNKICFPNAKKTNPKCTGRISQKMCKKNTVKKFFYSQSGEKCRPFYTEDCAHSPTGNVFDTYNQCAATCPIIQNSRTTMSTTNHICSLRSDKGIGKLNLIRYYYNIFENKCFQFSYKGIVGNDNRFNSEEECMGICNNTETLVYKAPLSQVLDELDIKKLKESNTTQSGPSVEIPKISTEQSAPTKAQSKEIIEEGDREAFEDMMDD